jgi:hypothetical protein
MALDGLLPVLGGIAATYVFIRALLHLTQDAKEPPTVETTLPFIGPFLRMAVEQLSFYVNTRYKNE